MHTIQKYPYGVCVSRENLKRVSEFTWEDMQKNFCGSLSAIGFLTFCAKGGQSHPGLAKIAEARVGIDRLQSQGIVHGPADNIMNGLLRGTERLLAVGQEHGCVLFRGCHKIVMGDDPADESQT